MLWGAFFDSTDPVHAIEDCTPLRPTKKRHDYIAVEDRLPLVGLIHLEQSVTQQIRYRVLGVLVAHHLHVYLVVDAARTK